MWSQTELVNWLLEAKTPTIRYLTARDLLGLPEQDARVRAARMAIMQEGAVPAILAKQTEAGHWANESSYYTPKYVSSHWSMLLLTELCIDPTDERFQRGVDHMLASTDSRVQNSLTQNERGFSCLWGNMLRYIFYAGRGDDPRAQALVEYVTRDLNDHQCLCHINDGLSCAWGVVRSLWGLALLPEGQRSDSTQAAIKSSVDFLLDSFRLVEANYPSKNTISPMWFKLNFPLFYQADILLTLRVLAELNRLAHPNAAAALDWLEARRQPDGRWHGSSPFRQRTWRGMGNPEETARWVSLQAALVLQQCGRFAAV